MVSPYELAFLANNAYRDRGQVRPLSYGIEIPQADTWGVGIHNGFSDSFFATKYQKRGANVIAFRGTGGRLEDLLVDVQHALTRNSRYIDAARSFYSQHGDRNTIVTGHSLGGFIAVSMAFHFTTRVVSFNAPWMLVDGMADNLAASQSQAFQNSRIVAYQSNTDVVTGATQSNRLRGSNVNYVLIGACGWHNIDPIVRQFRRNRRYNIQF